MRFGPLALVVLSTATSLLSGSPALAGGGGGFPQHAKRLPAALLLYPEFDNRQANLTLITVTNTNCDFSPAQGLLLAGAIDVEFHYIGKYDAAGNPINCPKFDRTVRLSPCDTFTFITSAHNPGQQQGFVYAFAKRPTDGVPIDFDHLIGNVARINGIESIEYSTNAAAFQGQSGVQPYTPTDDDGDGILELGDSNYSSVGERILVPRFLASGGRGGYDSELILIGLSGGAQFTTVADFLVYNDNEEVFSANYTFRCWDRVKLTSISGAFANAFLQSTNHAAGEILGANLQEAGWFELKGSVAFSTAAQIDGPAIYAVLVEKLLSGAAASDLPWESQEVNQKGVLFPQSLTGD